MKTKTGVQLIAAERKRQILKEGWDADHDDYEHYPGELSEAAICYSQLAASQLLALPGPLKTSKRVPKDWPWDDEWWKPKDPLRNLVRAGALIAAEIDKLQRMPLDESQPDGDPKPPPQ